MLKVLLPSSALLLVGLAGWQLQRTLCDQSVVLHGLINSDTLTCADFYQEVFLDGRPYESFYFPTTNIMFPDGCIYFAARYLTGATAPAMVLCTCALVILQLLGSYFVIRLATPREQRTAQTTIVLAMGALFLLVNARTGLHNPFFRLPLVLTYHAGSFICLLFGLALLLHLMNVERGDRPFGALAALFALTALGIASDRLVLIQLVGPAIGAMGLTRLLTGGGEGGLAIGRIAKLTAVLALGAGAGQLLLRALQPAWQDIINYYPFTLENGIMSLKLLCLKWRDKLQAGDELHWLTIGWIIATTGNLSYHAVHRLFIGRMRPLANWQRNQLYLSAHYLATTLVCIGAICYSGIIYDPPAMYDFDWGGVARYFLPTLFMPYLLIGLSLTPFGTLIGRLAPIVVTLGLLAFLCYDLVQCAETPRSDDRSLWDYYPPEIEELDRIAEKYGVETGVAGYWEAKAMTLFSRRHLKVLPVIWNPMASTKMVAFHWLNSGRCFFDPPPHSSQPLRYQFIVVKEFPQINTPSRTELIQRFGAPAAIEPCGPYYVCIYNRREDAEFQDLANQDCFFIRGRYEFKVGESIRFDSGTLPCSILGDFPPKDRTAIEGCAPAGVLSAGPLLNVRVPGKYRIKIVTSCSGDGEPSTWQVMLVNPKRHAPTTIVANGEVRPGPYRETSVEVLVNNRRLGRAIECDLFYSGEGVVQIHYVEVTRIE